MARMAAILAGNCDMTFRDCDSRCGTYFALMHCVNGWQEEVGTVHVTGGRIRTKKEAFLVKSHNAEIVLDEVDVAAENGVLVHSIVNDDPCATKVTEPPYGVNVTLNSMSVAGDLLHEDTTRDMWVALNSTTLTGVIQGAHLAMDGGSKWIATADSRVVFTRDVDPAQIDAPAGVTITAVGGAAGEFELASGGRLVVTE